MLDEAEKFAAKYRECEAKANSYDAHKHYAQFLRKYAEINKFFFMISTNNAQLMTHDATTSKLFQRIKIYNKKLLKETVDKAQTYDKMTKIYESCVQISENMAQIYDDNAQICQANAKANDELSQICEVIAGSKDEAFNIRNYKLLSSQFRLLCRDNAKLASIYQKEASMNRKDASLYRNYITQCRRFRSNVIWIEPTSLLTEICAVLGTLILLILTFYVLFF